MKGYRILFFTQEGRKVGHHPVGQWIIEKAKDLGASGATMTVDAAGFGHSGKMHSEGFFEMADRPITVSVTTDKATCEALMAAMTEASIDIFYCRYEVEYGRIVNGNHETQ